MTPKPALAFCAAGDRLEDEIDRRAAFDRARIAVVTWPRQQHWVGMASRSRSSSSSADDADIVRGRLSVAGLTPITASPAPSASPSIAEMAMP